MLISPCLRSKYAFLYVFLVEEKAADVYSPQFADQLELEKLHFGKSQIYVYWSIPFFFSTSFLTQF